MQNNILHARLHAWFKSRLILRHGATTDMESDDLDQHATDEKYNFEALQAATWLESQQLFMCIHLIFSEDVELTAADELVALEKMGVLQQNRFKVALEEDQLVVQRLKLIVQAREQEHGVMTLTVASCCVLSLLFWT